MHSADEIIPELQDLSVGDTIPLGDKLRMYIEILEPEHTMAMRSDDCTWVREFGTLSLYLMEPGSLVMERKMLLKIKERAERSAHAGHCKDDGGRGFHPVTSKRLYPPLRRRAGTKVAR
ncbi:hypothetical protein [Catenulispora rubra]|uniref:hypothetical protein n=1 Tax=Catenulispora rubra TaxID=280293 RepID=UPI001891FF3F|nr:hypothetical protein [Catenulispora rubra]